LGVPGFAVASLPQDDSRGGAPFCFIVVWVGDVVFDYSVEVEAAWFLEGGWGAVVKEVPGFAVVLPLILFVAGADCDGVS
jgi:hypothetical protein